MSNSTLTSEDADDIRDAEIEAEKAAERRQRELAAKHYRREFLADMLGDLTVFSSGVLATFYVLATGNPQTSWLSWAFLVTGAVTVALMIARRLARPTDEQHAAKVAVEAQQFAARVEIEVRHRIWMAEHEQAMAAIEEAGREARELHAAFLARRQRDGEEADAR